jgi:hypothetical protein
MNVLEHPKVKRWLEECRTESTRRTYASSIIKFFRDTSLGVDDYLSLPSEEKRHIALQYQNRDDRPNTIIAVLTALNSFLDTYDMKINFKGKKIRHQIDLDSHNFSNGDLAKMFDLGNTKEKALIALGVSLGWEVNAVLGLPRKQLQSYVDRAKAEGKQFFYFTSQRKKTGVPRLGVLNPLCLEWCAKLLIEIDGAARRKRSKYGGRTFIVSDVFDIGAEGANRILVRLAKQAHIVTTGRVHFHKLRGWLISGLSHAGFNEWQVKFLVGKAIPATDSTYLYGLQEQIEERYPTAYESYLNIKNPLKAVVDLSKTLEQKTTEFDAMKKRLAEMEIEVAEVLELRDRLVEAENELYKERSELEEAAGLREPSEKRIRREIKRRTHAKEHQKKAPQEK